ncbi:MAG: hypothetical protein LBR70_00435 [Lactobacillaceae bacterium]|jgi:uncharacterized protein YuzB (UPF0349 family)|nr:hypothetical protein [Lactobacillaceae bacterium]
MSENKEFKCCPEFTPEIWNEKFHKWKNKRFVKDKVLTFFYIPLNFGSVMTRLFNKIKKSNVDTPEYLCLSDHTSKWSMDIYVAVDGNVEKAENVVISGDFLSKVYDGPYGDTAKWMKDFENYAKGKNVKIKKIYMWYVYCPNCAKEYGHNYCTVIAEVLPA